MRTNNHESINNNLSAAETLIQRELNMGRYCGPFESPPFPLFQVSPLKLQPKKEPGKFRLIHNLSAPYDEHAINQNIPKEYTTVQYASIQDAISMMMFRK